MRQSVSTGRASIVAKATRSLLPADSLDLPYDWGEKLPDLVVGICTARSLILQDIAQARPGNVKTIEDSLSNYLGQKRLDLSGPKRACVIAALKRRGRRGVWKHEGKVAAIVDSTAYAKERSRGKVRPMPGKGKVRLHNIEAAETLLVPGYQEVWGGILLKDKTFLPLVRRLWTENGPDCASLNIVEESVIREVQDIVKEALGLGMILIADRGFRRKELLHWLKCEGMDFVIRLEGKLTVALAGEKGLLAEVSRWWNARVRIPWRDNSKRALVSSVASRRVTVSTESKERFSFNVLCLTPVREKPDPMFLATTLTTEAVADLVRTVRLYSWRWSVETFFWEFKQGLKADGWRVFSCWEAIDHLLAAGHMAYLVLAHLAEFAERGRTRELRGLWAWMEKLLRTRFARPPEMTRGRFFTLIAMDFPSPCLCGGRA